MDGQLASAVGFCCWSLDIGTWLFGSDGLFVILSDSDIFVLLSRLLPNWSLFLTPLCPSNLDASSLHSHLELSDVMRSDSTSSVMTCLFFFSVATTRPVSDTEALPVSCCPRERVADE